MDKCFCRTCTKTLPQTTFRSIFEDEIHQMLTKCTELIIEESDLPSNICIDCTNKLKEAYAFIQQAEEADQFFRNQCTTKTEPNDNYLEFSDTEILGEPKDLLEIESVENIPDPLVSELKSCNKNTSEKPENLPQIKANEENEKRETFTCPECGLNFSKELEIRTHRSKTHPDSKRIFFCEKCPKQYNSYNYWRKHIFIHSDSGPFICSTCKKFFSNPIDLREHERKKHSETGTFLCEICNIPFLTMKGLEVHLAMHKESQSFVCETCGKSFNLKKYLNRHTLMHNPDNLFSCKTCLQTFTRKATLIQHEMIHTKERPFICNVCGKGSRTLVDLKKHMLIHTGEKPHKCKYPPCKKAYRTTSALACHHRVHTVEGERKHVCEICGKKYLMGKSLKAHMTAHKGEKPHKCNLCGFKTAYKAALYTHKKSHKLL